MKSFFKILKGVFMGIGVICFLGIGYSIFSKDFKIEQMDWDQNGDLTLTELLQASGIDVRPVKVEGKWCKDYFYLKDGLTVKVEC